MLTSKGLSLVELLVTISIISVILSVAMPSASRLREQQQLASVLSDLRGGLALTRQEAIRTGSSVSIAPSANHWQNGWRIFRDTDHDGIWDAGEHLLREVPALPDTLSLSSNTPLRRYIRYTPSGRATLVNGGYQMGTLSLCENTSTKGYQLRLNNAGRFSVNPVNGCESF
jgi:type IV fimbrial biogenesis protein FimT